MNNNTLTVIILTFNEAANIQACLNSLKEIDANIFVVDSYSTDATIEILESNNIQFTQHPFENYSVQRNWSQQNNPYNTDWVFHMDAGERLTPKLVNWLNDDFNPNNEVDGYIFSRKVLFMNKWIKYGGFYPNYHLRLYKRDLGKCEEKTYDQHFVVDGKTEVIKDGVDIVDTVCDNLRDFTVAHSKWAIFEAVDVIASSEDKGDVTPKFFGNPIERTRWLKVNLFQKAPLFVRSFIYFIYRYFFRLGFLDGPKALIFHMLQGFWFRFLIDSIVHEIKGKMKEGHSLQKVVKDTYGMDVDKILNIKKAEKV